MRTANAPAGQVIATSPPRIKPLTFTHTVTKFFPVDPVMLRLRDILASLDLAKYNRDHGDPGARVHEQFAREGLHDLIAELLE